MDPAERRYLEKKDTPVVKIMKDTTTGFVTGTFFGTIVATWYYKEQLLALAFYRLIFSLFNSIYFLIDYIMKIHGKMIYYRLPSTNYFSGTY